MVENRGLRDSLVSVRYLITYPSLICRSVHFRRDGGFTGLLHEITNSHTEGKKLSSVII